MNLIYALFTLLLGYSVSAVLSANVAITLHLTVWSSIWTYVVILFWWMVAYVTVVPLTLMAVGGSLILFGVFLGIVAAIIEWIEAPFQERKRRKRREEYLAKRRR